MTQLGSQIRIFKGRKAPEVFDKIQDNCQPYLQIEDLRPGAVRKYARDPKGVIAHTEDVLIAWDGANAGTVGWNLNGYAGSTIAILRPSKRIHSPFLGYFLRGKFKYLQDNTTGATIPHLSRQVLEELEIPLPPLAEQQRIAGILGRADRLRRLRRYALEMSEGYLQAVFLEMFGDPATNPMGWKVRKLGELSDIQGGLQVSHRRNDLAMRLPYLRVANMYRNEFDLSEVKEIELTRAEFHRTQLLQGDVLVVEGHGNRNEIGRAAVWTGSIERCVHQNHLIRVRPHDVLKSLYLGYYLNGAAGRDYFYRTSHTTSGLNTISTNTVKSCPVLLPPIDDQNRFIYVVRAYHILSAQQREALRQTEHLFQALLQRAFRGEV